MAIKDLEVTAEKKKGQRKRNLNNCGSSLHLPLPHEVPIEAPEISYFRSAGI